MMRHISSLAIAALVLGTSALLPSGCGKKRCQPIATQAFSTVTGQEWRLVSTSNPHMVNDVTRFSFLIMVFKTEFSGELYKVENNRRYDTPIYTFRYNIASEGRYGKMRVIYTSTTGEATGSPTEGGGTEGATSTPTDYDYELRTGLNLTETKSGYVYEFVPFMGVVDPDSTCTF